tara:strand:+ start:601 stop:1071 length:471 start_codon:yes stop_codon:yes gene_type:complete
MTTKSSGFTLIELLVVVAVLGIISAIGTVTYQGYIAGTKKKSTFNLMRQIILANTEYYSSNQMYYKESSTSCNPSISSSEEIEEKLLDDQNLILDPNNPGFKKANTGYLLCVANDNSNFIIIAQEQNKKTGARDNDGCKITLTAGNLKDDDANQKC